MTDLTQVIRWNTGFVRGLAQSVLDRAKIVRSTLTSAAAPTKPKSAVKKKASTSKKPKAKAKSTAGRGGRSKKTLHG